MRINGVYLLLKIIICCFFNCHGFNVDIPSRIIHSSPQSDSWFGYSVAMYKHGNINTLLVGAPKYNTSQPGVQNGGAVLRCSVENSNRRCENVPFDKRGHMLSHMDYYIDNKSNQFFGATLKSKNGIVVACAPRYVWYTASRRKREPVGTCYVARQGMTDFQEFSPCRTDKWGYHRQGSCQAGFDAALSNNGERLYIGAPGAFYWQGQIHSQPLIVQNEYFTTGEGPADEDDQYLGYSVATGNFTDDGIQDVALGVPKGLNYTGKVVLYSHDLRWLRNITGDQLGSYFGYCLAVVDFNGDSLDDIIVGAPMYTNFQDREMKIEVGKVHVLLQNNGHQFRRQVTYVGNIDRGRFGLSVASLGDINLDGYGDFVVGAPYGGEDGRGAVFIYHGFATSDGVINEEMKRHAQVIYASEVGSSFSTFGWSLAGGIDIDDNRYPDLLVGAYEAEKALLLKSRPIIKFLEHKLEFKSEGKTIDIKTQNCEIKNGQFYTCMDLVFCLAYTGVNVDDNIELEVEYRLDTKQNTEQRLQFESNEQGYFREKIKYVKEIVRCRTLKTFLKPDLVDKLTPITANVSYVLIERRRSTRSLTPVLDQDQRLSMQDSLTIQKNCGPDNICIPDLVLTFEAPDEFIIGQKKMLNVSVRVVNNGEDAFESAVFISEPKGLLFNKFEPRENTSCSTRKVNGNSFVKCDIGNPLPMQQGVFFHVFFQQSGTLEEPRFEFLVTANSTNREVRTFEDNVARKIVVAEVDARLTLFGSSDPESLIYNTSLYQVPIRDHEGHYGPSLVHKYGLLSKGPSDIEDAEIIILWPSRTLSGQHLLYIMEQPITVGDIKCDPVPDMNPMNLKAISSEERARVLRLTNLESSHRVSSASEISEVELGRGENSSSLGGRSESSSSSSSSVSTSSSSRREETYSSSVSSSSKGGSFSSESGGGSHYSSSGGGRGGRYFNSSSSRSGGEGGGDGDGGKSYSSGSESRKTYSYSSHGGSGEGSSSLSRGETGGHSSSSDHGSGGSHSSHSYSSSSREGAGRGYSSSAVSGTGGSYSSSSGSDHFASSRGGNEGSYSSYGRAIEREGPSSYSSQGRAEPHETSGGYSSSSSWGSGGSYPSSSTGGRRTYPSTSRERYGGSYDSSISGGSQGTLSSSSNTDKQSGPVLPKGGTGGKFSSTVLTVRGGGEGGGGSGAFGETSSPSSTRTESERRYYGSASSSDSGLGRQYGSGSRETDSSFSQRHGGSYSSSSSGHGGGYSASSFGHGDTHSSRGGHDGSYSSSHASRGEGDGGGYSSSSRREYHQYSSSNEGGGGGGGGGGGRRYYSSGDGGAGHHTLSEEGSGGRSSHYERKSPEDSETRYSYRSSSSSSSTDDFYRQNEIESRRKREISPEEEWESLISECGATLCTRIRCRTGRLTTNDDVYIYIRSRLWVDTLSEFKFPVDDVTITTRMVARANILPQGITSDDTKVYSKNVVTPIRSAKSLAEAPPVPWWVILLATLAGILILLLIILILWKCGYFKRHRPRHKATLTDDSQPLNPSSNGTTAGINGQHRSRPYFPGDEAL